MNRPTAACIVVLACTLARPAAAQLIGPIPPATTPAPAQSTGLAPAEIKPPPSEPDAPSIVEHDKGRLKPLPTTPDEAAVARYPFEESRRTNIAASLKARSADLDRFVITKLDRVLEAQNLQPQVEAASDFDTLFKARDTVAALKFERPLDRLLRDGAITLEHKTRLDEAVREYETARKKQNDTDAAGDPTRAAVLALRQTFDDATRELFISLERQLTPLADHFDAIIDSLSLRPEQTDARRAIKQQLIREGIKHPCPAPAQQRLITAFWHDVLDIEQKRAALTAARAAATPPIPQVPAKP
jgi:hypothetical protein